MQSLQYRGPSLSADKIGDHFLVSLDYWSGEGDYGIYSGRWQSRSSYYIVSADLKKKWVLGDILLEHVTEWPQPAPIQTTYREAIRETYLEGRTLCFAISQRWYGKEYYSCRAHYGGPYHHVWRSGGVEKEETKIVRLEIPSDCPL